jgi:glycosyltransferase involved in cell wall biosynthesis
MSTLVSIIVPVFNEESIIQQSLEVILNAAKFDEVQIELIVIDDGSSDATLMQVELAMLKNDCISLISFTRNFGKEAAIEAGLTHAQGQAAIIIDCDLQHPPELIPEMIRLWKNGLLVVHAIKNERAKESVMHQIFVGTFYTLFRQLSGLDLKGYSDFKLVDRRVIDVYLALPEKQRFFRGLISWANFPSALLPFNVKERADGSIGKWSQWSLFRYAVNNITGFSSLPLKLVTYLGVITLLFGAIIGINSLLQKIQGEAVDGFTTVNLLIIVMGGSILISLGVIGHYLAKLYDEIKARPNYLINEKKKAKE